MAASSPAACYAMRSVLVALMFAGFVVASAHADPLALAEAFCAAQESGDRERLRPLMTPDLATVVAEAEARNKAVEESSPDVVAPLAAGVPYQSFAEPAENCAPGAVSESANLTLVDVVYTEGESGEWTDRLVLKLDGGRLGIDDILFASFPTDTYQAGLRRVLADSFDE